MEWYSLQVFRAVATERSFSRAAEKLFRTQPAVSLAVQRLEAELGERLIVRGTFVKRIEVQPASERGTGQPPMLLITRHEYCPRHEGRALKFRTSNVFGTIASRD